MSGEVDIDKNKISDILDNSLETGEGITGGIAGESDDMGEAIGLFITIGLYIALIILVLGIVFIFFKWIKSLRQKSRM